MCKIMIVGDIHSRWNVVNSLIIDHSPDILLSCGDVGWWPHFHGKKMHEDNVEVYNQYGIQNEECKIYWADGNHENHQDISNRIINNESMEFAGKNIFYQRRGSVLTLPDGRNVLFFGGAISTDKSKRMAYVDWWPNEVPDNNDFQYLKAELQKVEWEIDIVISHTAPTVFLQEIGFGDKDDPTVHMLDYILGMTCPKQWFFGHFHHAQAGSFNGCSWHALSCATDNSKWERLGIQPKNDWYHELI